MPHRTHLPALACACCGWRAPTQASGYVRPPARRHCTCARLRPRLPAPSPVAARLPSPLPDARASSNHSRPPPTRASAAATSVASDGRAPPPACAAPAPRRSPARDASCCSSAGPCSLPCNPRPRCRRPRLWPPVSRCPRALLIPIA
nr:uncharacterized protein C10orf95-like [Aegilops tauschii subsp. strangulata]